MNIFPAIDLYNGCAVRLFKGDYNQLTVYSKNPVEVAFDFKNQGAEFIHLVDLEGARDGTTPNSDIVNQIKQETGLFCEIGGGIRSADTVKTYLSSGVDRVILGTSAVTDEKFLIKMIDKYGAKIAVGADIEDSFVAIKGWTEKSNVTCDEYFCKMQNIGVSTIICTDISKDGAMKGTNRELYKQLSERYKLNITASGGVSSLEDIRSLRSLNLYGAIIGKAYYTGAINLKEALEEAK